MAAAVRVAHSSSPRLQPLHPVLTPISSLPFTHSLNFPAHMEKKHFMALDFAGQQHHAPVPVPYDDEEFEEDVDEDDISDFEEELQQELLARRQMQQQQQQQQQQQTPDMTQRLLNFAEMVNADIQKFFGRKKGDDESCDIYEDKWVVTKSGRELYYADLLRIAQGDYGDSKVTRTKREVTSTSHKDHEMIEDNRHSFSGKADSSLGLGPLKDLFDYGLRQMSEGRQKSVAQLNPVSAKRIKPEVEASTVPMQQRRFPDSFWREPGSTRSDSRVGKGADVGAAVGGSVLLGAATLPDFSDLMESWHGENPNHHLSQQQLQHHLLTQQQLQHLHQQQTHVHRSVAGEAVLSGSSSDAALSQRL